MVLLGGEGWWFYVEYLVFNAFGSEVAKLATNPLRENRKRAKCDIWVIS